MRTTIQIKGKVEKTSQAGKVYWSIDTDQGVMSCFEKSVAEKLDEGTHDVEVVESKGYKNIRAYYDKSEVPVEKVGSQEPTDKFKEAREEKNRTMYVAYAKDILVALMPHADAAETLEELEEKAINSVKRFISAF